MDRVFYYILKLVFLAGILQLQACGRPVDDIAKLNIIGGKPVTGNQLDNVVAIMRDELTVCTGTLIAPDLVLTAAHCFEKSVRIGTSSLSQLKVVVGNSATKSENRISSGIVNAKIHPRFWEDYRGAMDFAWVRISPPLPQVSPAFLPMNRWEIDTIIAHSSKVLIAGFGLSALKPPAPGESPQMGVKLQGESPIKFRTGVELFAGNSAIDGCSGDSGGPAFVATEPSRANPSGLVLVGVTSRGPMPCASDYEAGAYGLVTEAVCWLRSSASYRANDPILRDFCVREAALGPSAHNDSIIMEKPFLEACMDPELPEASRHDLRQLFRAAKVAGNPSQERCSKLQDFLTYSKTLDLHALHLRQLSWLRHASNVEILDVSDNMLLTTRGVESLKNLKTLDIRNNAIVDLQELQNLRNKMKVFGITTQLSNQTDTKYREIAQLGAAAGSDKRSLIIALRDILAVGDIERKSRDLALKRQICLDERGLRSLTALEGLENLETLSLAKNPDIKDWQELLSLPRLKLLRYSSSDNIPSDVLSSLKENGTQLLVAP